jgi:hypothetical protein
MKSDIEKNINDRVSSAFSDILPDSSNKHAILKAAQDMVHAVWIGKIYSKLPKDKTTIAEFFFDAELEQFLNEAIAECYEKFTVLADRAQEDSR